MLTLYRALAYLAQEGRAGDRVLFAKRVWNADLDDDVDYVHLCRQATGMADKLVLLRSTGEALSQPELDQRALTARRLLAGKLSAELRSLLSAAPAHGQRRLAPGFRPDSGFQ